MELIWIVFVLILVGGGLYIVQGLPIDSTIKRVVQVVVILGAVLWMFGQFGYGPGINLRGHR